MVIIGLSVITVVVVMGMFLHGVRAANPHHDIFQGWSPLAHSIYMGTLITIILGLFVIIIAGIFI